MMKSAGDGGHARGQALPWSLERRGLVSSIHCTRSNCASHSAVLAASTSFSGTSSPVGQEAPCIESKCFRAFSRYVCRVRSPKRQHSNQSSERKSSMGTRGAAADGELLSECDIPVAYIRIAALGGEGLVALVGGDEAHIGEHVADADVEAFGFSFLLHEQGFFDAFGGKNAPFEKDLADGRERMSSGLGAGAGVWTGATASCGWALAAAASKWRWRLMNRRSIIRECSAKR